MLRINCTVVVVVTGLVCSVHGSIAQNKWKKGILVGMYYYSSFPSISFFLCLYRNRNKGPG